MQGLPRALRDTFGIGSAIALGKQLMSFRERDENGIPSIYVLIGKDCARAENKGYASNT